MKKNIFKLGSKVLLCTALLLGVSACSNFLDEEDPTNLDPDKFYTAAKHADAALNAVYADTRFYGDGAGIFSSNWQLLEAPTGTTTTETAQNSDLNNLYSLTYDPNTGHVQNWWRGVWKLIGNANLVMTKVPNIKMDEVAKKKIIGEASFLRAWAYFYAVRLWGKVPIELEPHYVLTERAYPARSTEQEVYDLIVSDLQVAEAAGLNWTETNGRVSTAAVKSLLAKVYLTMAGYPLEKGQPYYALAAAKAKEVIDNAGTLDLFGTYNEIHDEANNNRKEHIFMIQYNQDVAANPMTNMFPNFKPITYRGNSGTGSTIPTKDFYNSFEPGDRRAVNQQGWFYTSWYKDGVGPAVVELGAPYIFKHFNVKANGGLGVPATRRDNLSVPVIRYAEVLLIYAEAQNAADGAPNQLAYDSYKRIRDRAQLLTPALATFTQATFQEAVWRERWYEFCFEGITWFDMVRLQKVFNHTTKGFDNFVGHENSPTAVLQEKHLLFPIPRQEILSNPNLKPQNDGYPEEF
jgi:hypothetical protein